MRSVSQQRFTPLTGVACKTLTTAENTRADRQRQRFRLRVNRQQLLFQALQAAQNRRIIHQQPAQRLQIAIVQTVSLRAQLLQAGVTSLQRLQPGRAEIIFSKQRGAGVGRH